MENTERNEQIVKLKENGMSVSDISKKYGLSRTRIDQIYKKEVRKSQRREIYKKLGMKDNGVVSARLLRTLGRYYGKDCEEITIEDILSIDKESFMEFRSVGVRMLEYLNEIQQGVTCLKN